MKSNVVMQSQQDRNLFGITIRQETKTGFLNLTDLQNAYNKAKIEYGWVDKRTDKILSGIENVERVYYVLKEQGLMDVQFLPFIELVEKEGITKILKKLKVYRATGTRNKRLIWCHDSIWILLSLELSPVFYAKTVIWLRDDLIRNRIEAGNFCRALNGSIQRFHPDGSQYVQLAKALNYIVFGRHEPGIRNTGSREQLKELFTLEEKMAFAIDMGYINSFIVLLNW